MSTRPQTLYGLADSPIDLAAFMLDHGDGSGQPGLVQQVLEDRLERPSDLTRDDILDNITLFWLTNTGVSSARLYWESKLPPISVKGVKIPVGVSTFADEIYRVPQELGRAGVPEPRLLHPARQGRPLRRLGTAAAALRRRPRDVPIAAPAMTLFARVRMPSLAGATEWLDSEPLGPAELRGHVVLVNFWTWTCINWLRQEPYVRAWSQAYRRRRADRHRRPHAGVLLRARRRRRAARDDGAGDRLPGRRRQRLRVWSAFANHFWPALYFVDADGIIRDEHFGEGRYEQSERVIQRLLGVERELVAVEGLGVEAEADWDNLRTPETYLGYGRGHGFASPDRAARDERRVYEIPERLPSNHWGLAGEWTIGRENVVAEAAGGSIAFRFGARDAHLVLSSGAREPIPFRVLLDGEAPGPSHGVDVDEDGNGVLRDGRLYQLVREHDAVRERTLEIAFLEPGAEAYAFTFG